MTRKLARSVSPPPLWQDFKRQTIQDAVVQLMCRDGLEAVTMERVASEAGVAKGTLYLHFADKQALLEAVKNAALDPLMIRMDEVFRSALPPHRKLETYALRYLSYFDERKQLFRILLYEREVQRAQGSRFKGGRYRHLVQETARVIEAGMAEGSFRPTDPEKAAVMFVESSFATMTHRLVAAATVPVEEDARLITDLFLGGLSVARSIRKEVR
jgi:AcrR family transcriptional regulator